MNFSIEEREGIATLVLKGWISGHGARVGIRTAIKEMIAAGRRSIVIDMTEVSTMDLQCVGEIFASVKMANDAKAELWLITKYFYNGHVTNRSLLLNVSIEQFEEEDAAVSSYSDDSMEGGS